MTLDNYLQEVGALATLAGILGGFAFSGVVQLLDDEQKNKFYTPTIVTFSLATVMFIYSLVVFILLFAAAAEMGAIPDLESMGNSALLVMLAALIVFLAGIALAGWIRSKTAGIFSTAFALITACMILFAVLGVASVFA